MTIQNITNGKIVSVTQKEWDGFSRRVKSGFKVLNNEDALTTEQIVKKIPPPSGTKKNDGEK